ncbi:MAG: LptF/LptG family permease [Cyanobacteria bacterium J06639_1]
MQPLPSPTPTAAVKLPPRWRIALRAFLLEGYLVQEMIQPFFLGVGGGTILLLGNQLFLYADLLVKKGAPPITVLQILILNLPAILVVTFPIAGLFATLLALGRLGADSEMTALRAAGVSQFRIFVPILLTGLAISALAFATNDFIVPYTNGKVRTLNENLFLAQDVILLEPQQAIKIDDQRWFYIGDIERKTGLMRDVLVFDRRSEAGNLRFPQIITANTADWDGTTWELRDAILHRYDQDGFTYYEGGVEVMELNVARELVNIIRGTKVPQEQSSRELLRTIQDMERRSAPSADIARLTSEWHLKFSIPFASFFSILIAAPLGLQAVRQTGRYGGVAVAIGLVFVYYLLLSLSRSLGQVGTVAPWLAAWIPNLAFGVLGSGLLWRFVK